MGHLEEGAGVDRGPLDDAEVDVLEAVAVLDQARGLAQDDGVAEVGDDLPAGPDQEVGVGPLDGAQLVPVPWRDVVHDREQVETDGPGPGHELVPLGGPGVGVAAVLVEVGVVPPGLGPGHVAGVDRVGGAPSPPMAVERAATVTV